MAWSCKIVNYAFVFASCALLSKVYASAISPNTTINWIWSPNVENLWTGLIGRPGVRTNFGLVLGLSWAYKNIWYAFTSLTKSSSGAGNISTFLVFTHALDTSLSICTDDPLAFVHTLLEPVAFLAKTTFSITLTLWRWELSLCGNTFPIRAFLINFTNSIPTFLLSYDAETTGTEL